MKENMTELFNEFSEIRDSLINGALKADQVGRLCFVPIRDAVLRFAFDNPELRESLAGTIKELKGESDQERACLATLTAGIYLLDDKRAECAEFVEIALNSDSVYSLARLLNLAIGAGIPATVWADSLSAVSITECLEGAK